MTHRGMLPLTQTLRVDEQVFAKVLRERHQIEGEYTRTISMNEALRMLLDFDSPPWMIQSRVRG